MCVLAVDKSADLLRVFRCICFRSNCSVEHSSQKKEMEVVDEQQEQGGAGAAGGDAEYAVVQGAFATGFSVPGRTTPGFTIRWEGDVQNRTLLKVRIGFSAMLKNYDAPQE